MGGKQGEMVTVNRLMRGMLDDRGALKEGGGEGKRE